MRSLDAIGLPKTVAGVIAGIMDSGQFLQSTNFKDDILIRPSERNPHVPDNIYLLCGDATLDSIAAALHENARRTVGVPPFGRCTPR